VLCKAVMYGGKRNEQPFGIRTKWEIASWSTPLGRVGLAGNLGGKGEKRKQMSCNLKTGVTNMKSRRRRGRKGRSERELMCGGAELLCKRNHKEEDSL